MWLVTVFHFIRLLHSQHTKPRMACFAAAELASSFFGTASRNPKHFTLLCTNNTRIITTPRTKTHFQPLNSSSFSRIFRNSSINKLSRRFSVSSSTSSPPQTDSSDEVSTVIPPDNRIPATIITGFLGSGKVTYLHAFSYPF